MVHKQWQRLAESTIIWEGDSKRFSEPAASAYSSGRLFMSSVADQEVLGQHSIETDKTQERVQAEKMLSDKHKREDDAFRQTQKMRIRK